MNKPIPGAFAGYHNFKPEDKTKRFEVFWADVDTAPHSKFSGKGWYWWQRIPGSLPVGKPHGPFATPEGAYLDAIGD